ncbi:MAG: DUF1848 domain-containing protein [Sporomusaceae bacterium]|nr:DUF1848 domain-containing protein [Sporomusaceae bacterium]
MAVKGWDKLTITTDDGEKVEAIAPIIISASRATDIPAFHSEWFMNRLNAGYVKWMNPFHASHSQYVSFEKTRVIVFWTKNPRPIITYLDDISNKGLKFYFTFTVNDYEAEGLEPNVPPLHERINTFIELSNKIGKERVIWRFDPLILTDSLDISTLLARVEKVGDSLYQYTDKLVISFADIQGYPKVQKNLKRAGIEYKVFTNEAILEMAKGIQAINKKWNLSIATCGEAISLQKYGIMANKCIDDELMLKCFSHDKRLMEFLGYERVQMDLFSAPPRAKRVVNLKDIGQRAACECIVSKDIGQYNTCMHLCLYCYANYYPIMVRNNFKKLNRYGETILT